MRFITMHSNSLVPQQKLAEYRFTTLQRATHEGLVPWNPREFTSRNNFVSGAGQSHKLCHPPVELKGAQLCTSLILLARQSNYSGALR